MKLNIDTKSKILIYAEGSFGNKSRVDKGFRAKTADGLIRYSPYQILGVIDSTAKEQYVSQVLVDVQRKIPILKSAAKAAFDMEPDYIFIGTAPEGDELPNEWKEDFLFFLEKKIPLVSGIHFDLLKDPRMREAVGNDVGLVINTRYSPDELKVGAARAFEIKKPIVLTVGSDAAIGKMTVTYELYKLAARDKLKVSLIPTGQTAVMIEGWGYSIDAIVGDFMAGAVEEMVISKIDSDIILVEGQGSLLHPGFSNTTISLIHGAVPTHMILVHRPQRKTTIGSKFIKIPPLREVIKMYEGSVLPKERNCKVVGIALNTKGMSDNDAREEITKTEKETNLPVTDVLRFGSEELWKSLKRSM